MSLSGHWRHVIAGLGGLGICVVLGTVAATRICEAQLRLFAEEAIAAEVAVLALVLLIPTLSGGCKEDLPLLLPAHNLARWSSWPVIAGIIGAAGVHGSIVSVTPAVSFGVVFLFCTSILLVVPLLVYSVALSPADEIRALGSAILAKARRLHPTSGVSKTDRKLADALRSYSGLLSRAVQSHDVRALGWGLPLLREVYFALHGARRISPSRRIKLGNVVIEELEDLCEAAALHTGTGVALRELSITATTLLNRSVATLGNAQHSVMGASSGSYDTIDILRLVGMQERVVRAGARVNNQAIVDRGLRAIRTIIDDPCATDGHLGEAVRLRCMEIVKELAGA